MLKWLVCRLDLRFSSVKNELLPSHPLELSEKNVSRLQHFIVVFVHHYSLNNTIDFIEHVIHQCLSVHTMSYEDL